MKKCTIRASSKSHHRSSHSNARIPSSLGLRTSSYQSRDRSLKFDRAREIDAFVAVISRASTGFARRLVRTSKRSARERKDDEGVVVQRI